MEGILDVMPVELQKMKNKQKTLEELCPYADKCAVEPSTSEVCSNDYTMCKIYQELIKYKEQYLRK